MLNSAMAFAFIRGSTEPLSGNGGKLISPANVMDPRKPNPACSSKPYSKAAGHVPPPAHTRTVPEKPKPKRPTQTEPVMS